MKRFGSDGLKGVIQAAAGVLLSHVLEHAWKSSSAILRHIGCTAMSIEDCCEHASSEKWHRQDSILILARPCVICSCDRPHSSSPCMSIFTLSCTTRAYKKLHFRYTSIDARYQVHPREQRHSRRWSGEKAYCC